MFSSKIFHVSAGVILLVFTAANYAAPVFKSTDEQGNVTYSSTPSNKAQQVEEIAVPKSSSGGSSENPDESVEQIKNKANELERERLEREKQIRATNEKEHIKQAEEQPRQEKEIHTNPRPIIQNRPLPPKPTPLPSKVK